MTFRRSLSTATIIVAVVSLLTTAVGAKAAQAPRLPSEISDADFWRMIVELSEPGVSYPYENFVSNELQVQDVIPALKVTTKLGGVYIGVGPEQNFTYVAALQSQLAFVIDIRRQNMLELLMYKALFECRHHCADDRSGSRRAIRTTPEFPGAGSRDEGSCRTGRDFPIRAR